MKIGPLLESNAAPGIDFIQSVMLSKEDRRRLLISVDQVDKQCLSFKRSPSSWGRTPQTELVFKYPVFEWFCINVGMCDIVWDIDRPYYHNEPLPLAPPVGETHRWQELGRQFYPLKERQWRISKNYDVSDKTSGVLIEPLRVAFKDPLKAMLFKLKWSMKTYEYFIPHEVGVAKGLYDKGLFSQNFRDQMIDSFGPQAPDETDLFDFENDYRWTYYAETRRVTDPSKWDERGAVFHFVSANDAAMFKLAFV